MDWIHVIWVILHLAMIGWLEMSWYCLYLCNSLIYRGALVLRFGLSFSIVCVVVQYALYAFGTSTYSFTLVASDPGKGGSEAPGCHDTEPSARGAPTDDVTARGAVSDPAECLCGREETLPHHGVGLQPHGC